MRFGVNQNLNKVKDPSARDNEEKSPLRLRGGVSSGQRGTNTGYKGPFRETRSSTSRQNEVLLGAFGENEGGKEIQNYSLPIFFGTTILSLFVLEFSFSRKEGVRVKGHAKINN